MVYVEQLQVCKPQDMSNLQRGGQQRRGVGDEWGAQHAGGEWRDCVHSDGAGRATTQSRTLGW